MPANRGGEALEFFAIRESSQDQEIGDLEEAAVVGKFFDGDPSVAEDALLAVDEGDGAATGTGVRVTRVVSDVAGLVAQARDVDRVFPLGSLDNR